MTPLDKLAWLRITVWPTLPLDQMEKELCEDIEQLLAGVTECKVRVEHETSLIPLELMAQETAKYIEEQKGRK